MKSLTNYEVQGLSKKYSFADGHAYQPLNPKLLHIIEDIPMLWKRCLDIPTPELENEFKKSFSNLINSSLLNSHNYYSICPTASSSIDIIAAYIKSKGLKVGLIEPCFDNLHLILKRRTINVKSITEDDFVNLNNLRKIVLTQDLNCLFLVSPNNPTGFKLSRTQFIALVDFCKRMSILLVIDTCFRFFSNEYYSEYDILLPSGIDFITIEDTGKTWPTQDMKLSLLVYSATISNMIRTIYEEIYLCVSKLSLILFTRLMHETKKNGLNEIVLDHLVIKMNKLKEAIERSGLQLKESQSMLPLAWIDCKETGFSDYELVDILSSNGIMVLPGRPFLLEYTITVQI